MNNKSITILSVIIAFSFCLPLFAWNGSGTYEDPYEIATLQDLQDLQTAVNGGANQSGVYFLQTADIDLSSVPSWSGIGTISSDLSTTNAFSGDYDGDGYSVSGMTIYVSGLGDNQESKFYGLFGAVDNAVMANIFVQGKIVVKATANVGTEINIGSIVASANGNCLFEGLESYVDIYYENPNTTSANNGLIAIIGGVLGRAKLSANNTWTALKNHGKIIVNSPLRFTANGIFGHFRRIQNNSSPSLVGFENYGSISLFSSASDYSPPSYFRSANACGIGFLNFHSSTLCSKCVNFGDITITGGVLFASGLFTSVSNGEGLYTLSACANYGNISLINADGMSQGVCGLAGGNTRGNAINASTNAGNISVSSATAGRYELSGMFAAAASSSSSSSSSSYNFGNLSFVGLNTSGADEVSVGGLFTPPPTEQPSIYISSSCVNYGRLSITSANKSSSAKFGVGGLGCVSSPTSTSMSHSANLKSCVNFGELSINVPDDFEGIADVSGLVAAYSEAKNDVKINWSYNLGSLKWSGKNVRVGGLMGLEEATTASDEYTHIDHSYSVCSYEGSLDGNYVGSVVGYAKSTTAPITVSNSFGVAINRNLPAFGYFNNAYTNNVKGYAWEEVYRDLNISGFYLPSSKFNQPTKTSTFFDLICPMNTEIFPTDTDEAKKLHNAILINGYKRYVKTNRL